MAENDTGQDTGNAAVQYYAGIMQQLTESERFTDWFSCNFDIQKIIDDENKTIEYRVIEVPVDVVQERMLKLFKDKTGVEETKITLASPAEAAKILERK